MVRKVNIGIVSHVLVILIIVFSRFELISYLIFKEFS